MLRGRCWFEHDDVLKMGTRLAATLLRRLAALMPRQLRVELAGAGPAAGTHHGADRGCALATDEEEGTWRVFSRIPSWSRSWVRLRPRPGNLIGEARPEFFTTGADRAVVPVPRTMEADCGSCALCLRLLRSACRIARMSRLWMSPVRQIEGGKSWQLCRLLCHRSACRIVRRSTSWISPEPRILEAGVLRSRHPSHICGTDRAVVYARPRRTSMSLSLGSGSPCLRSVSENDSWNRFLRCTRPRGNIVACCFSPCLQSGSKIDSWMWVSSKVWTGTTCLDLEMLWSLCLRTWRPPRKFYTLHKSAYKIVLGAERGCASASGFGGRRGGLCSTRVRAESYAGTERGCASAPTLGGRLAARTTEARAKSYSGEDQR